MSRNFCAILVFVSILSLVALQLVIERAETVYFDKKFVSDLKISVRRLSRKSPYLIFCQFQVKVPVGNNVTISVKVLENLSGRYVPTLITFERKLCDFYSSDKFLGQLIAKNINATCPQPLGFVRIDGLEVKFDWFTNYVMPFTWPYKTVNIRCDLSYVWTNSGEPIAIVRVYGSVHDYKVNK